MTQLSLQMNWYRLWYKTQNVISVNPILKMNGHNYQFLLTSITIEWYYLFVKTDKQRFNNDNYKKNYLLYYTLSHTIKRFSFNP